jgi:hypothetical protein
LFEPKPQPRDANFASQADAWRKVAQSIPLGSKVKVQTFEGRRKALAVGLAAGAGVILSLFLIALQFD